MLKLKPYQNSVLADIKRYLYCFAQTQDAEVAFQEHWETFPGGCVTPQNGTTIEPYKLEKLENIPNVCVKVPTGGGKTFIACYALNALLTHSADSPKVAIWLVPSRTICDQTLEVLRNQNHPYRQTLDMFFQNKIQIIDKNDLLNSVNFNEISVQNQVSIVVLTFQSLRAKDKEERKLYKENTNYLSFARSLGYKIPPPNGMDKHSAMYSLRALNPVIIVDESHNAESELSFEMLNNLNPRFVLDFTATPRKSANIISFTDAYALKRESMVKLPIIVFNQADKQSVIQSAINLQDSLEKAAIQSEAQGHPYIRPIVLFQAQSKSNKEDNVTFEQLKKDLVKIYKLPLDNIAIKTAFVNEIKDQDLLSPNCSIRYIITVNALKEGWDCSFAYILASLADKHSDTDVTQIVGRILRQPYAQAYPNDSLNRSYVFTASAHFHTTLQRIVDGLKIAGFSERDYKVAEETIIEQENDGTEAEPNAPTGEPNAPISEPNAPTGEPNAPIREPNAPIREPNAPIREPNAPTREPKPPTGEPKPTTGEPKPSEPNPPTGESKPPTGEPNPTTGESKPTTGESKPTTGEPNPPTGEPNPPIVEPRVPPNEPLNIKETVIQERYRHISNDLYIPHFYIQSVNSFSKGKSKPLKDIELMEGFNLANEDIKIDFSALNDNIAKVDLDEFSTEHKPIWEYAKEAQKEYLLNLISKPESHDKLIFSLIEELFGKIGNPNQIADRDIRDYLKRLFESFKTDQFKDFLEKKSQYAAQIKTKIIALSRQHREQVFEEWLQIEKIRLEKGYSFPLKRPLYKVTTADGIRNALYMKEESMNSWEEDVIGSVANLDNIEFWTRNEAKKTFFVLNGAINHYPDFIAYTKSGKIILIESKGDHLDGSDSQQKMALGAFWEKYMYGKGYYFMIFKEKKVVGGFLKSDFLRRLSQL